MIFVLLARRVCWATAVSVCTRHWIFGNTDTNYDHAPCFIVSYCVFVPARATVHIPGDVENDHVSDDNIDRPCGV